MKITKYTHACIVIKRDNTKLILDPGSFTDMPDDLSGITHIVITEEHYDHFNTDHIKQILASNPNASIYSTEAVVKLLQKENISARAVLGEQTIALGDMQVSFYETDHAVVYQKSPCKSLAVKVDDAVYYPSDTFSVIPDEVNVLMLPTSGPWFKVSESIECMNNIKSKYVIPTHNALNSETGNKVTHNFLQSNLADEREFVFLQNGESLEI